MANYLMQLDDEIAKLRTRIDELETARRVIATLQEPVLKAVVKKKATRRSASRSGGAYTKVRKQITDIMASAAGPWRSREIIDTVMQQITVGDSTVWKVLKDMRDDGLIRWDSETRQYTPVPLQPLEKLGVVAS